MSVLGDRDLLVDHFFQQQLQLNPGFCSLVESGDVTHENALKDFARLCIENVEWKMTEFASLYSAAWSRGGNSVDELKTHSFYTESFSMQNFKDRISLLSMTEVRSSLDMLNPIPIGAHRLALRACHLDLVNDLVLLGTTLLDDLVANHLMEESDVRSIVANTGEKSMTEAFLRRIQVMFTGQDFVDKFIPILSKYYPDTVPKLLASMPHASVFPDFSKCYNCQVKAFVEPRLLADVMYANGTIVSNLHQDLREQNISNQEKWDKLTTEVKDHRDILETLRIRLPSVYQEFDLANAQSFDCWCHMIITQPALPTSGDGTSDSSVSDIANIADLESVLGAAEDEDEDEDESYAMCISEESEEDDCSDDYVKTGCGEIPPIQLSRIKEIFSCNFAQRNKDFVNSAASTSGEHKLIPDEDKDVLEHCETQGAKRLKDTKSETRRKPGTNADSETGGEDITEPIYSRVDKDVLEHCETKGAKRLKDTTSGHRRKSGKNAESETGEDIRDVIYSREDNNSESHSTKRSLRTTVRSFLNRQLYSIRLLSARWKKRPESLESYDFQYDGFLAHADEEREFALESLRWLEDEFGLRICQHERDFRPGVPIASNVVLAIQKSRNTVIVMSSAFCKSYWCWYEYHVAILEAMQRHQKGPVVVMYEFVSTASVNPDFVLHLARCPYLDYASTKGDDTFWHDLATYVRKDNIMV